MILRQKKIACNRVLKKHSQFKWGGGILLDEGIYPRVILLPLFCIRNPVLHIHIPYTIAGVHEPLRVKSSILQVILKTPYISLYNTP